MDLETPTCHLGPQRNHWPPTTTTTTILLMVYMTGGKQGCS
jgi:hypothetical protein